jgi:two-component system CheB/CheR fusion protein
MGDAVLVVDDAGKAVLRNAAYERMFGASSFTPEDEAGRPLPPEQWPEARAAQGASFEMQFVITDADGGRRWFEANGQPIRRDGAAGGVVIIRDISERSLRRLQDQFVAMASHELRTPLTALDGYLQILGRQLGREADQGQAAEYVAHAREQSRRLATLVNDLMDVARLQSGRLRLNAEPLDLAALVARTVEVVGSLAEGRRIVLERGRGNFRVHGDAGRLDQVFLNLLNNAVRHAPQSERIDVRLRRVGGLAEVAVQDYGPGIPPEKLPGLFSPYSQVEPGRATARDGMGLGLFISRELVQAHGGTIEVASAVGEGTTFRVRLPLLPAAGRRRESGAQA